MFECRNRLKELLREGRTTRGLWVTLESPTISEIAATLGFDWIVIDAEHGHLDFKEIADHVRAVKYTQTTPLVRVQEIEQGLIKRVLDLGALGILVPQVTSAEEVERAVQFSKYPPWGIRGVGGERATHWNLGMREYTRSANDQIMVIPLIETVAAEKAIDAILAVKGVDAIYLGPADFSASAGHLGEWEGPGVATRLQWIKDRARVNGVPSGVMATSTQDSLHRARQGFRMLGLGSDVGLLLRAAQDALGGLSQG